MEYRIDAGAWALATVAGLHVPEGRHLVEERSLDNAGNRSPIGARQVFVDLKRPLASVGTFPPQPNEQGWFRQPPAVSVSTRDGRDGSGPDGAAYKLDAQPFVSYLGPFSIGPGSHTLQVRPRDHAGLVGDPQPSQPKVDLTAPVARPVGQPRPILLAGSTVLEGNVTDALASRVKSSFANTAWVQLNTATAGLEPNPAVANGEQSDSDLDGVGDACAPDRDGDGFGTDADNCADAANPDQADSDVDGVGDACELSLAGRMKGGGAFVTVDGVRVAHGFQPDCDAAGRSQSLKLSWGGNRDGDEDDRPRHRFELKSLATALCGDNPAIANASKARFDTYAGTGAGSYDGVAGASASWTSVDAGEGGRNDTARVVIQDTAGATVLDATATFVHGNHQALHERR